MKRRGSVGLTPPVVHDSFANLAAACIAVNPMKFMFHTNQLLRTVAKTTVK